MLVELEQSADNKPVGVNPNRIDYIESDTLATTTIHFHGGEKLTVDGDFQAVLIRLNAHWDEDSE